MGVEEISKVRCGGSIRREGRNLFLVNNDGGSRSRGPPRQGKEQPGNSGWNPNGQKKEVEDVVHDARHSVGAR